MHRTTSLLVLAGLLTPAVAKADSDGYYCAGPGYLAYETQFSTQSSGHLLHIVQFSRSKGIVVLEPIELEAFPVHGPERPKISSFPVILSTRFHQSPTDLR